ncbi:MAG: hypothetical protein ABIQ30_14995 [Devosia sp.]
MNHSTLAVAFSILLLTIPDASADAVIRSSTDKEMSALLAGCWTQQATLVEQRFERMGYFNSHEMCFLPKREVEMWSLGGNKSNIEGVEGKGRYAVEGGKLLLRSAEPQDGWPFFFEVVSCDVLIVPNREMKLHSCLGAHHAGDPGYSQPATSWTRKVE